MGGLHHSFRLGGTELEGNLFLAPVAGYSDKVFRNLCASFGAALVCTEMVSAEGLVRGSRNTEALLATAPGEKAAVQLFGSEPDTLARASELLPPGRFVAVDINCGCPVPKIVRQGAGSALLRDPSRIERIVRAVRGACGLPVTVKLRLGWDEGSLNYLETAEAAQSGGAAAVCLHCRTREQFYGGTARWEALSRLKAALSIPVVGNGDIFGPQDAARMLSETGCDAAMFARGALGRPYVFRQTIDYLERGTYEEVPVEARVALFLRQLEALRAEAGELAACQRLRKIVPFVLKGIPNSAPARQAASRAETVEEYREALAPILESFSCKC